MVKDTRCIFIEVTLYLAHGNRKIIILFIKIELILSLEYEDFEDIFSKKECETVLESTRVTYIINLKEGIKSLFRLIYSLSERDLRILRYYFAEKEAIG